MLLLLVSMILLLCAGVASLAWERRGRFASPGLEANGDLKRELQFLEQYGQFSCLVITGVLILSIGGLGYWPPVAALVAGSLLTLAVSHAAKRLFGRIRPGRERDGYGRGAFLGPTWRRLSWRESFPSSHAASAFAMSMVLAEYFPQAAVVWWLLAGVTSLLRWMMDAHWLSDVLMGAALGIVCGLFAVWGVEGIV